MDAVWVWAGVAAGKWAEWSSMSLNSDAAAGRPGDLPSTNYGTWCTSIIIEPGETLPVCQSVGQ